MSKPLPPKSGFPIKMVVLDADGEPADAFDLSKTMQGAINRFTAAARQQFAEMPRGNMLRQLPDGQLRFTKNQDQEQLVVTLTTPSTEVVQPEDQPYQPPYPDFCVVDLVLQDAADLVIRIVAIGVRPNKFLVEPFADQLEFDYPESAASYADGKDPGRALMRYARKQPREGSISIDARVSSLLFDLREIAPGDRVEVDVWGATFEEEEEEDPEEWRIPLNRIAFTEATLFSSSPFDTPLHEIANEIGTPTIDPLGNPSSIDGPKFNTLFDTALDIAAWDETEYTDGDPNSYFAFMIASVRPELQPSADRPQDSTGYEINPICFYSQKRFDPITGALIALRRVAYAASGFVVNSGNGRRATAVTSFYERIVPPEGEEREVDVTSEFIYAGEPKAYSTPHSDGAGIWALGSQIPTRQKIGSTPIKPDGQAGSEEFSAGSGELSKLGKISVDRAAATATFEPA